MHWLPMCNELGMQRASEHCACALVGFALMLLCLPALQLQALTEQLAAAQQHVASSTGNVSANGYTHAPTGIAFADSDSTAKHAAHSTGAPLPHNQGAAAALSNADAAAAAEARVVELEAELERLQAAQEGMREQVEMLKELYDDERNFSMQHQAALTSEKALHAATQQMLEAVRSELQAQSLAEAGAEGSSVSMQELEIVQAQLAAALARVEELQIQVHDAQEQEGRLNLVRCTGEAAAF